MTWFKRDKKSIEQATPPEERRVRTEGLWVKCESCNAIVFRKDSRRISTSAPSASSISK
jgi:acetyl-CoA carboxylase carboxyl transferase subunit beta